jgi:vacuolar iron transporter family protein
MRSGFPVAVVLTFLTLFVVGATRALVTTGCWWRAGGETLVLGMLVAVAAYGSGTVVGALVNSAP